MEKPLSCQHYRSYLILLIFSMLAFNPNRSFAETITHTAAWTSMSYYGDMTGNKWHYFVNPQIRFIDNRYKLHQVNLYLGLSYQAKDDLDLLFGVFRNYIQEASGTVSGENRFWQQASASLFQSKLFDVSSRSRLEERIMNGTNSYANRFRQLISFEVPFMKNSHLIMGNEFFLQLNKPEWVSQRTYSQNRFNVGVRNRLGEMAYEIGYLNQYVFNNVNEMSNVLYINIAFSKKYSLTTQDVLLDN